MNAFTVSFIDGVQVGISGGKSGVVLGCLGETRQVNYASVAPPSITKMVGCHRTIRTANVVQIGERTDFDTVQLAKDQAGLKPNESDQRALVHAWFLDHCYHVDESNEYPRRYMSATTLLLAHWPRRTVNLTVRYDVLAVLDVGEWFQFSHNGQDCYVTCEPPTAEHGHTHVRLLTAKEFDDNPVYAETAARRHAIRVL